MINNSQWAVDNTPRKWAGYACRDYTALACAALGFLEAAAASRDIAEEAKVSEKASSPTGNSSKLRAARSSELHHFLEVHLMPSRLSRRLFLRAAHTMARSATLACLATAVTGLHAQNGRSSSEHPDSRLDIYGGYSYLHPVDSGVNGYQFHDIYNPNATASVTGWFNHYLGVQAEGSYFSGGGLHKSYVPTCSRSGCDQLVYTAEGGPVFRLPLGRFVPFAHILGGGERTNGPAAQSLAWGWGATGGLGVDYVLPFLGNHLAVRPIQADFQYSQVNYGTLAPAGTTGGVAKIDAVKLSGGVVVRFGEKGDTQPVMLACSAEPTSVHPGDAITVTASTLNLNPKRRTQYTWTANGGKLTPAGATAAVDTTGLAPGEYTVRGQVSQARSRINRLPAMRPSLCVLRRRPA